MEEVTSKRDDSVIPKNMSNISRTAIVSFLFTALLLVFPFSGSGQNNLSKIDSLVSAGIENSRHGRFKESNDAFSVTLNEYKPSNRQRKVIYDAFETAKVLSYLPTQTLTRPPLAYPMKGERR